MYFLYFSGKDTKRSKKNFAVFSQKSRDLCGSNPRPLVLTRTYVGTYVGTNTVNFSVGPYGVTHLRGLIDFYVEYCTRSQISHRGAHSKNSFLSCRFFIPQKMTSANEYDTTPYSDLDIKIPTYNGPNPYV